MRVRVDRDLCESNAVCVGLLPQVFELDDDENMVILRPEVAAGLESQIRLAVRSCPKTALRLEDEAGNTVSA